MIAVVTILAAFPLGFFLRNRLAANTAYAIAYLWEFVYQTLGLRWTRSTRARTRPSSRRVPAVLRDRRAHDLPGGLRPAPARPSRRPQPPGASSGELALVVDRHHRQRGRREHRRQRERRRIAEPRSRSAPRGAGPRPRRGTAQCSARQARPDQNGPARSATAVNASPLSATVTAVATTIRGTASDRSSPAVAPSSTMVAAAATVPSAVAASGCATTSESWPAAIRPSAPATWATGDQAAGRGDQSPPGPARPARRSTPRTAGPRAAPRHRGCGAGKRSAREGLGCRGRPGWPAAGGSSTTSATKSEASRRWATRTDTAAYGPWRSATTAMVAAATPTPTGWAICRMPHPA